MSNKQFTFTDIRLGLGLFSLLAEANTKTTGKVDYFIHKNLKQLQTAWGEYVKSEDDLNRVHLHGEDFNGAFFYKGVGKDEDDVIYVTGGQYWSKTDEGFVPYTGKRYWETEAMEGEQPKKMHYQPSSDDIEKYYAALKELQEGSFFDVEPHKFPASEMGDLSVDWTRSAEAKNTLYDKYIDHEG